MKTDALCRPNNKLWHLVFAVFLIGGIIIIKAGTMYSTNVCGWYQVVVPAGQKKLVAIQLINERNTIMDLFDALPGNSFVDVQHLEEGPLYGSFSISAKSYFGGKWSDPDLIVPLGYAVSAKNAGKLPVTLIFVGEVPLGAQTYSPKANSHVLLASLFPVTISNPIELGYMMRAGDTFRWDVGASGVTTSVDASGTGWTDGIPFFEIGDGFFFDGVEDRSWTQSINVHVGRACPKSACF